MNPQYQYCKGNKDTLTNVNNLSGNAATQGMSAAPYIFLSP